MGFFERLKRGRAVSVQTAREQLSSAGCGGIAATPLYSRECAVYEGVRAAIPVVDAAIEKICRLVGGCAPKCEDEQAQRELEEFFSNVPVGPVAKGIESFVHQQLDSLLTYGSAVGEVVLGAEGDQVVGLYCPPLRDLYFERGESPLEVRVLVAKDGLRPVAAPYPQLIVCTARDPLPGELRGRSLLEGLPFVCDVLSKIYASMGQNFERIANLRYAVTYRPGNSSVDRAYASEIAQNIAEQWADAMNSSKNGRIKDFVAVGDVDVKVIGADNQMIDTEGPVRQMLEQIVAKLGVPPFLLGLHWSSTERMSMQQADMLTSELESYRRLLTPAIQRICALFLRVRGYACDCEVVWEHINLQDELELANARLTELQADKLAMELKELEGSYAGNYQKI